MHSELVAIKIGLLTVKVTVPCEPNTPEYILKKRAINIYLREQKKMLYIDNHIEEGENISET
jgi:hypothetical protein